MTARAGAAPGTNPGGFRAMRDRVSALAAGHRSTTIIVGWIIVATALPLLMLLPPFSTFQNQKLWIDGFANAGVFILLAIGLNIVVGFAGLLDLGYAAFYAIGAYTYALAASPTVPWISMPSRSGRCSSWARPSRPCSASSSGRPP